MDFSVSITNQGKEVRVTHVTNGKRDLDHFLSDMKID